LDRSPSFASDLLLSLENDRHMYVTGPITWEWGLPARQSWKEQYSHSCYSKHSSTYTVCDK
jgi:hypothetical protein